MSNRATAVSSEILAVLRAARTRIEALEKAPNEPIAIVSMACRMPGGADDPHAFWDLLCSGRDAIVEVPQDRFDIDAYYSAEPDAPGKTNARGGGFIRLPEHFDAEFFGISPREAASLDPQQRLILEVSWEALENAGIVPDTLDGREVGVFMGVSSNDYSQRLGARAADQIDAYMTAGVSNSMAAGRLSYILGVKGPSLTVDTACSSSLVALHLACQSLRNGECESALVGAASQLLSPEMYVNFAKARMLSPDSRCHTFDAAANGFARAEGCAVIVLKRMTDAVASGDRILAVLLGSAVNHDGHTSGITVPSGPSQQAVIRRALKVAGVEPRDVQYIETHGTGTPLGDPIEVGALGAIFAAHRSMEQPLLIGSVKSNIGHLEAAAGMAGVLKVVLSLMHGEIPPNLHFKHPNPHIAWNELPFSVPTRVTPFPRSDIQRIAGVSSFGFSGTNAHIVLATPPAPVDAGRHAQAAAVDRSFQLLTLAARTQTALEALARSYARNLEAKAGLDFADFAYATQVARTHFSHRLGIVAATPREAAAALLRAADGQPDEAAVRPKFAATKLTKIAFLFTGQGSQYAGMGRVLYGASSVFRQSLDRCAAILAGQSDIALIDTLYNDTSGLLDQTALTQPALFAVEYSLAQLWISWGIKPAALAGHSVGEYVAACVAGVFSLEDGLKLIAARGRLMQALPRDGAMYAVMAAASAVRPLIDRFPNELALAAINTPQSVVISGRGAIVENVVALLAERGVSATPLAVSHAFHSPLMEPMLADFREVAESVRFAAPRFEVISNATGAVAGSEIATADYWCRHVRAPVRFADGIAALRARDCRIFLELGPKPVLCGMGRQCIPGDDVLWLPSLRNTADDWQTLLASAASLYVQGATFDWRAMHDSQARKPVLLPNYPFERKRHWIEAGQLARSGSARLQQPSAHPLLGSRVPAATSAWLFQNTVDSSTPRLLADHRIADDVLVPATAFIEMALAAGRARLASDGPIALDDLVFHAPLAVNLPRTVQLVLQPAGGQLYRFDICSRDSQAPADAYVEWTLHASGRLGSAARGEATPQVPIDSLIDASTVAIPAGSHYASYEARGVHFGASFRRVNKIWRCAEEALAELEMPPAEDLAAYLCPPTLLDSALQLIASFVPDTDGIWLPLSMAKVDWHASIDNAVFGWIRVRAAGGSTDTIKADVRLLDRAGNTLVAITDFVCRRLDPKTTRAARIERWLHDIVWKPTPHAGVAASPGPGRWLIFADAAGVGTALAAELSSNGATCVLVRAAEIDARDSAQIAGVIGELANDAQVPLAGIVHCWALDTTLDSDSTAVELMDAQAEGCGTVLAIVQALAAQKNTAGPSLWLVTRGSQAVDATSPAIAGIAHASLWGFGRVIARELPELRCRRVDLDAAGDPASQARRLSVELLAPTSDDELALRGVDGRYVPALVARAAQAAREPLQLVVGAAATIEDLRFQPAPRRTPAHGEVEIKVRAAGLGFRDVLNALGMYPGGPLPLGAECSGKVVAVGDGVTRFVPGDLVCGFASGCFGSHAIVKAQWLVHKPSNLQFEQAAAIPSAFLTACYTLEVIGKLRAGQTVLIHAGAGGVGLAAIQIARAAGARIFATAGSARKRAFLTTLGVERVFDSRTLDFADEILQATGGAGVDLILNSLADEFLQRTFDLIADHGCFVEIGKRGILSTEEAARRKPHAAYHIVDLAQVAERDPAQLRAMLESIFARLAAGTLQPLPVCSFPLTRAADAFRTMAQARHTGKIVLTLGARVTSLRRDACYLVTGGLGAVGLAVAHSLIERGASHLVLFGRHAPSPLADAAIQGLRAAGATVCIKQGDVANRDAVQGLLTMIDDTLPPLAGIIHCAGVLDDGVVVQQDWSKFARAMAPKIAGAWNLQQLTRDRELDFLVLFSAAATVLGLAGQANYIAANAFMDGLAHYVRGTGRHALSIDWGAWAISAGMAGRAHIGMRLEDRGLQLMSASEGVAALERAMREDLAQLVVLPIDWHQFFSKISRSERGSMLTAVAEAAVSRRFSSSTSSAAAAAAPAVPLRQRLREAPVSLRRRVVWEAVQAQIRRAIGLAPDHRVDEQRPLQEFGLDSLMAVELRNGLAAEAQMPLPATFVFDYPVAAAITDFLIAALAPEDSAREGETPAGAAADAEVVAMSDAEAAELLMRELAELKASV